MSDVAKVAIITGASGGIGSVVAERLAADGFKIVANYAERSEQANDLVKTILSRGGTASAFKADVADEVQAEALFEHAREKFGGVDVVVNTAGLMVLAKWVDIDFADFDRMVRINVRGTFVISQLAARQVRRGGSILNFSSSVTKRALPTYSAYIATKGAVDAATMVLARELRGRDVSVNAIAPGPTSTPMFLKGKSQELVDTIAKGSPLERIGTPTDIATTVAYLVGPGHWINGQVIYCDGGMI